MATTDQQWYLTALQEQLTMPMGGLNLSDVEHVDGGTLARAVSESAQALVEKLEASAHEMLQKEAETRREFEATIPRIWGRALDCLEVVLTIAIEANEELASQFSPAPLTDGQFDLRVLMDLHARGCQVGQEILLLLRGGYPDGAYARWRTLHELAVIASFIGQDTGDLAERYIRHESIESYKAASEYQNACEASGERPMAQEDIAELQSDRDELLKQYGSNFAEQYGWASSVLGKKKPTFRDIEERVDLRNARLRYMVASYNVHASAKGIMAALGVPPEKNLHLTGASNYGLAAPGQGAAISAHQLTAVLLSKKRNINRTVTIKVMELLVDRTVKLFLEASGGGPRGTACIVE